MDPEVRRTAAVPALAAGVARRATDRQAASPELRTEPSWVPLVGVVRTALAEPGYRTSEPEEGLRTAGLPEHRTALAGRRPAEVRLLRSPTSGLVAPSLDAAGPEAPPAARASAGAATLAEVSTVESCEVGKEDLGSLT